MKDLVARIKSYAPMGLLTTACLAVIFIVSIAGVFILGGKVKAMRLEIDRQYLQAQDLSTVNNEMLRLKNSIKPLQGQTSEITALIPTRKQVLQNIETLERISAQTGSQGTIKITESPNDPKRKQQALNSTFKVTMPDAFGSVDYTLSLTGTFIDLMKYLEALENQSFLTVIKKVDLVAEKASAPGSLTDLNTGRVNTTIEATFFYTHE